MIPYIPIGTAPGTLFTDAVHGITAGLTSEGIDSVCTAHEFTIIRAGSATVQTSSGTYTLRPGDAAVFPRSLRITWRHDGPLQRIFMAWTGGTDEPSDLIRIDPFGPLAPAISPAEATLLTRPVPTMTSRTDYRDSTGQFLAGVWQATAYCRHQAASVQHELMQIVQGEAKVEYGKGEETIFALGDAFLTARGAVYALGGVAPFRKIFCIFRAA